MTLTHFAIIAVCAYLFGSLSFAIIVSKVTLGKDIRNYGSGNAKTNTTKDNPGDHAHALADRADTEDTAAHAAPAACVGRP